MDTILFLHGWGGDENSFAAVKKYFEREYRVLSPAMSCPPADGVWTMEDYATYIEGFLRDNDVTRCHIVCHSFGARVAALLITRSPELVRSLVVCGGAGLRPRFRLRVWLKIRLYKLKRRIFGTANGGSNDYRNLTANGKQTFNNVIARDLKPEIAAIETPTLLIYGSRDRATPVYMGRRWKKLCVGAELKIYRGAGHFAYLDKPAEFIKDVENFIKNNHA